LIRLNGVQSVVNYVVTKPQFNRYVAKPEIVSIFKTDLEKFKPAFDTFERHIKSITIDEVKKLFPTGKLEDNYIIEDIKKLLSELKTKRKIIDLEPNLSDKDYSIIQSLMNKDYGRFIQQWKGYSDTDTIPNIQKLALFTRTMRLTKQTNEFLEFNPHEWEMIFEGITKKPREIIMPLLKYKANSYPINVPLSENKITKELKLTVDKITDYINMFTVKKDFIGYRGDETFNILSSVTCDGLNISLAELMERYTQVFKDMYAKGTYNINAVNDFVKKYVLSQKIHQKRFMSIGMTQSAVKNYAKKIKWRITIPKGTKGASIESFNIERLNEAEFLGQRNGVLKIRDARYCPKKDLWYFDASLEQNQVDEIIVNC